MTELTKQLIEELKKTDLTLEDRTALTTALLNKLVALPISNMIVFTPKGVMINNRELEVEQAVNFRMSVLALKDNNARKIIHEQIKYLAINTGVHNGLNQDSIMFSKAALWCLQEEEKLLEQVV